MASIGDIGAMANEYTQSQIKRDRTIAASSFEAVRRLRIQERKALLANKPERQFSSSQGYYDPRYPWSFHRKDGTLDIDEPLREFHAQLHRLDLVIKGI